MVSISIKKKLEVEFYYESMLHLMIMNASYDLFILHSQRVQEDTSFDKVVFKNTVYRGIFAFVVSKQIED